MKTKYAFAGLFLFSALIILFIMQSKKPLLSAANTTGYFPPLVQAGARFNPPYAVTTEGTFLYVANAGKNIIERIAIASGNITTFAGAPELAGCTDATGTAAHFNQPNGIVSDGTYLYVSDTGNHTIRRIEIASRRVTTLAGTPSLVGFVDGAGTEARFNHPLQLTTDGASLYVFDAQNEAIRKIDMVAGVVKTLHRPERSKHDTTCDETINASSQIPVRVCINLSGMSFSAG
jgi:DNA-binding beta-propeller fold protein YncE